MAHDRAYTRLTKLEVDTLVINTAATYPGGAQASAGDLTITAGNLIFTSASAKIIPGVTSLLFRDTADGNTNLGITNAGVVTVRAGLTVTAGGITITAGNLSIAGDAGGATTIIAGTVNGLKIGTAASQKLGFFNAAPVVQQTKAGHNNWAATSDVVAALVSLGLFDTA